MITAGWKTAASASSDWTLQSFASYVVDCIFTWVITMTIKKFIASQWKEKLINVRCFVLRAVGTGAWYRLDLTWYFCVPGSNVDVKWSVSNNESMFLKHIKQTTELPVITENTQDFLAEQYSI